MAVNNEGSNAEPVPSEAPPPAWWTPAEDAVPARIKAHQEDFRVEECPLDPDPQEDPAGAHLVVEVTKRGRASEDVARQIARVLELRPAQVGYCGRKDVHAVTVQRFSLEGVQPEQLAALEGESLQLVALGRRREAFAVGDHRGNRFRLKLREVPDGGADRLARGLSNLERDGLPNAFGDQRFGARGDNGHVGLDLLAGRSLDAVGRLCGTPGALDFGAVLEARVAFEAGDFATSAELWPRAYGEQAALVRRFAEKGADERAARESLGRLRKGTLKFYLNAAQSQLFNQLLYERVAERQRWLQGDVLELRGERHAFDRVEQAEELLDSGEATPLLPLFGRRDPVRASGAARSAEDRALERHGLDRRGFGRSGPVSLAGSRRTARCHLGEVRAESGSDSHGPFTALEFRLPSGAYATQVVGELCQGGLRVGPADAPPTATENPS